MVRSRHKPAIDFSDNIIRCRCGFRMNVDSLENREQICLHIDSCKTLATALNDQVREALKVVIKNAAGLPDLRFPDLSAFSSLKF